MHSSRIQSSIVLRIMPPFGCQKISPAPGDFLDGEQVELLAEHAMVARLAASSSRSKCASMSFLREEGRAVNALQLLDSSRRPASRRRQAISHLERLHPAGRRHMRPAAEVDEVAVAIERNLLARLGEALDEVDLHEVALRLVLGQTLLARLVFAHKCLVARRPPRPSAPRSRRDRPR